MFSYKYIVFVLVSSFLLSACSPTSLTPYPTYDPFAPVTGSTSVAPAPIQTGVVSVTTKTPTGPTPTHAPISVAIPARVSNSAYITPTPDAPHPLPPLRQAGEQYTIQPGDTLFSIAQANGVSLEALMQADAVNAKFYEGERLKFLQRLQAKMRVWEKSIAPAQTSAVNSPRL